VLGQHEGPLLGSPSTDTGTSGTEVAVSVVDNRVRGIFVNSEHSLSEVFRRRRWDDLLGTFPDLADMSVLDLGGTTLWWRRAPVRPRHVTVVNLHEPGPGTDGVAAVRGDACRAAELTGRRRFDLVLSNSLLEHLGGHRVRSEFAEVVRASGDAYWVQTPYRYFPIEPHWVFPGFQFLPVAVRARIAPRWPMGHTHGWSTTAAREEVMSTELASATELRSYFPDGTLRWERVGGVPKSMTIVRLNDR
jgi:hypothetical protein